MKKGKSKTVKLKSINLEKIQQSTKRIYEMSSEISLLQEELEDMLTTINQNFMDFKRGKISREFFKANEKKLKTKSLRIIKRINTLVDDSSKHIDNIIKEVQKQAIKVK
jgi:hypothetical protein